MEDYRFSTDPVANPKSTVVGPQYRFTVLDDRVIRYEWAEDGVFEDRPSTFALFRKFSCPDFRVEDNADSLEIVTPSLRLTYDKKRFSASGLYVAFFSKLTNWGSEWRFGQGSPDNLGGTARTLDDVDGRRDMGAGILSKAGYAILDDTGSMLFEKNGFVSPRRAGDRIDGYIFSYGRDYRGAMESFYAISGQQPKVPRWCLGNWWSRYHAYSQAEYLNLMKEFKAREIPMSVAVIDMDWHWVKEDFVPHSGWTGYTWNTDLFPDPTAFGKELHDMRLKMTLNDHPHLGIHHHEEMYEELARVLGRDASRKDPIEFDPTSPKFMHAFFNVVHRNLERKGCDFWWIDWQQGQESRIPGFDPLWLLNHYQYLDTKLSNPASLPIVFSRYAGPGSHRYPVGFSGDTIATWASLQFQPEFTATASNIGYGWWSHDIGGHMPGYRNDECIARWVQYGVFSPILRLHSTNSQWMSKEPWIYRDECSRAMSEAMQFRHRLVPYIYSASASEASSLPLVQPVYWEYPQMEAAYSVPNQYFFGPSAVVAPIVTPRDPRTNMAKVTAWIPPRKHVDLFTGIVYDGERVIDLYRPLDQIPVLLVEGSILPMDSDAVPQNGCVNPTGLEVAVVVGQNGHFNVIEDPRDDEVPATGEEKARYIPTSYHQAAGRLSCVGGGKSWTFRFLALDVESTKIAVRVNGVLQEDRVITSGESFDTKSVTVHVPATAKATDEITIDLGPKPQLRIVDHTESLRELLKDYQIDFRVKDKIWDCLQSRQSRTVKLGHLFAMQLEEALLGPVLERMLADGREVV